MPYFPCASLIQLNRAMKLLQLIFYFILFLTFQSDPAVVKATLTMIMGQSLQNKKMVFVTLFI